MLRPFLFSAVAYLVLAALLGFLLALGSLTHTALPFGLRPAHVHVALLGSVSQAMLGAIPFFSMALLAAMPPDAGLVRRQWWLANVGTLAIAATFLGAWPLLGVFGAVLFLVATAIVGSIVYRMMGRSLVGRRLDVWYYFIAALYGLIGMALGLLLISGSADAWWPRPALRLTHLHLSVVGWVSLTIVGTMYTFFPTVIGARAGSPRLFRLTFWLVAPGVGVLALGLAVASSALTFLGGLSVTAGAILFVFDVFRSRRAHAGAMPLAAAHLFAAALYFLVTVIGGLVLVVFDASHWTVDGRWLIAYAHLAMVGWIVQTLIGAMAHLMPVLAGGMPVGGPSTATPERHYTDWRVVMGSQAGLQFWLLNGGLIVFVLAMVVAPSFSFWAVPMIIGAAAMLASLLLFAVKVVRLYRALRGGR